MRAMNLGLNWSGDPSAGLGACLGNGWDFFSAQPPPACGLNHTGGGGPSGWAPMLLQPSHPPFSDLPATAMAAFFSELIIRLNIGYTEISS